MSASSEAASTFDKAWDAWLDDEDTTLTRSEFAMKAVEPIIARSAWAAGYEAARFNQDAYESAPLGMRPIQKTNPYRIGT